MKPKAIFNWSTGKDSALALHHVLQAGEYDVMCLLTTINAQYDRVSMHGVRTSLLERQAESLGIPLVCVRLDDTPTMDAYERAMTETLSQLKNDGATVSIFGDIFLEDLRAYRERRLETMGLRGVFPLWKIPTTQLARDVIDAGFTAITTCVNDRYLGKEFVGRTFDDQFLAALPSSVDPCGENGEFHSFVCDGPIFTHPVAVEPGEIVYRTYERPATTNPASDTCGLTTDDPYEAGFWYCDLLPILKT